MASQKGSVKIIDGRVIFVANNQTFKEQKLFPIFSAKVGETYYVHLPATCWLDGEDISFNFSKDLTGVSTPTIVQAHSIGEFGGYFGGVQLCKKYTTGNPEAQCPYCDLYDNRTFYSVDKVSFVGYSKNNMFAPAFVSTSKNVDKYDQWDFKILPLSEGRFDDIVAAVDSYRDTVITETKHGIESEMLNVEKAEALISFMQLMNPSDVVLKFTRVEHNKYEITVADRAFSAKFREQAHARLKEALSVLSDDEDVEFSVLMDEFVKYGIDSMYSVDDPTRVIARLEKHFIDKNLFADGAQNSSTTSAADILGETDDLLKQLTENTNELSNDDGDVGIGEADLTSILNAVSDNSSPQDDSLQTDMDNELASLLSDLDI